MIKAENLTKIFGGKKALDSVNVTIGEGSIYGLVGSNGSGKSTLLRLASGVYMPDGGSITANGEKIFDNPQIKARIAYLGDTPYFMPNASIKETADFYRRLYPRFDNTLYNRLLEIFPLDYKAKISTRSKGMQRQAALITAIASSPDYLLLDEAFDGLDVVIRKALKGILVEGVTGRNMTTVIASHNLRELEDLCDSVGLVHNGHMVLSDEVFKITDSGCFGFMTNPSIEQPTQMCNIQYNGKYRCACRPPGCDCRYGKNTCRGLIHIGYDLH